MRVPAHVVSYIYAGGGGAHIYILVYPSGKRRLSPQLLFFFETAQLTNKMANNNSTDSDDDIQAGPPPPPSSSLRRSTRRGAANRGVSSASNRGGSRASTRGGSRTSNRGGASARSRGGSSARSRGGSSARSRGGRRGNSSRAGYSRDSENIIPQSRVTYPTYNAARVEERVQQALARLEAARARNSKIPVTVQQAKIIKGESKRLAQTPNNCRAELAQTENLFTSTAQNLRYPRPEEYHAPPLSPPLVNDTSGIPRDEAATTPSLPAGHIPFVNLEDNDDTTASVPQSSNAPKIARSIFKKKRTKAAKSKRKAPRILESDSEDDDERSSTEDDDFHPPSNVKKEPKDDDPDYEPGADMGMAMA